MDTLLTEIILTQGTAGKLPLRRGRSTAVRISRGRFLLVLAVESLVVKLIDGVQSFRWGKVRSFDCVRLAPHLLRMSSSEKVFTNPDRSTSSPFSSPPAH